LFQLSSFRFFPSIISSSWVVSFFHNLRLFLQIPSLYALYGTVCTFPTIHLSHLLVVHPEHRQCWHILLSGLFWALAMLITWM
jgi:hypothetical protein